MAFTNSHNQPASTGSVSKLVEDVMTRWNEARERRAVYLRTLNELSSMTDRELSDINLSRLQVGDIAREAAYGQR